MSRTVIQDLSLKNKSRSILLDNDFLSCLFSNEGLSEEVFNYYHRLDCYFLLDDYVRIEFLTSPLNKSILETKSIFLKQQLLKDMIVPALQVSQKDNWERLMKSVLIIRRVYYMYNILSGVSLTDFVLIATLLEVPNTSVITGNIKHFSAPFLNIDTTIASVSTAENNGKLNQEVKTFYEVSMDMEQIKKEYDRYSSRLNRV